ncbi:MAG: hypothetical protein NW223_23825 [Hyphomicrobiaceae bacterium]|nr:hypothetical protein [Hyphomicrobiaceae bacterium]
MRGSLVVSVLLHSGLLASVLLTIRGSEPPRIPELEPMAVDLISQSDVTKLRQGARNAKQMEALAKETPKSEPSPKEAEKPKPTPAVAPPPPPPPPEAKEEVKPEPPEEKVASVPPPKPEPPPPPAAAPPPVPAPDEQKKLDDLVKAQEAERQREEERKEQERKEQERKAEEHKKQEAAKKAAEAKKKAEEKKRREAALKKKKEEEEKKRKEAEAKSKNFGEDISALLNKMPDKGSPAPPSEFTAPNAKKGPVLGAPEGRDRTLSASELAILAQIIKSCVQSKWNVMSGGEGAQSTSVKVRLRFNPDGRLAGAPIIQNPQSTPYFLALSDSALRAVQACEPYPLPADKYEVWKDIVLNFDPRDMYR